MADAPDPAAIRLAVLDGMLSGREGWTRTGEGWGLGPYELVPRRGPGLSYELWKANRCVAALMVPRDAIAVCECLAEGAARRRASAEAALWDAFAIPQRPA